MTTKELANELEVNERTIHRDLEALTVAGIPIESIRGKNGGWKVQDNWSSKLSWLKESELHSLFAPYPTSILIDLNLHKEFNQAREKLIASLPPTKNPEAHAFWKKVYIDNTTWRDASEEHENLTEIKNALFHEKRLKITYKKYDGRADERIIEPLGMVSKGDKWYLVALKEDEFRNYRISRIISAHILKEHFIYPKDFNLEDYWKASKQQFVQSLPKYDVYVSADKSIAKRIGFSGHFVHVTKVEESQGSDWVNLTLTFHTEQEAIEFVTGFGNKLRVVSPLNLKALIVEKAKELISFYAKED